MAGSYFMLKILKRKRNKLKQCTQYEKEHSGEQSIIYGENVEPKCRVCLKQGDIPIYGSEKFPDISEKVIIFGNINLNEDDDYPKHLCNSCYSLLQNAVVFRKTAKETDEILHQTLFKLEANREECDNLITTDSDYQYKDDFAKETSNYCKLSNMQFSNTDEYLNHKSSKKHKNVRIKCSICFRLLTPQLYKRHLARHQSTSHLVCEICGKIYRKDNLLRHLQLHSFELPFQCQICPYRGRFMESLKIHMRTHTGVKPFSCDKCQLRFLTRSNLNRHLLTHRKERPNKCVECERGFYTKRDLDVHFKSDHVGIKDFVCTMCGNKYGTHKALMRHELRVHKRDKMSKGRMPLYLRQEYRKLVDGS